MTEVDKFVTLLQQMKEQLKSNLMASSSKDDWQCLRISLQHLEDAIYNIERNLLENSRMHGPFSVKP